MWLKIGNKLEAGAIPATVYENGYTLNLENPMQEDWEWYIRQSLPPYETVFTASHYWADIPKIAQWMPETCKALLEFPETLKNIKKEEQDLGIEPSD